MCSDNIDEETCKRWMKDISDHIQKEGQAEEETEEEQEEEQEQEQEQEQETEEEKARRTEKANRALHNLHNHYHLKVMASIGKTVKNSYGETECEDISQLTWKKIYEQAHRYNPQNPLLPWILKIAIRESLNYLKVLNRIKNQTRSIDSNSYKEIQAPPEVPDTTNLSPQFIIELLRNPNTPPALYGHCMEYVFEITKQEMNRCCPKCIEILRWYLQGMKGDKMAQKLNKEPGAARQQLAQCKACLKKLVQNIMGDNRER